MKVILLQQVKQVGEMHDVKDVSEGYARNFLFPKNLAVPATPQALLELEARKRAKEKQAVAVLEQTEHLAGQLDGYELDIAMKAGESGTLFASVTSQKIQEALLEKGFQIDKKYVRLEQPIKEVGEYDVPLNLPEGLEATVRVVVTAV